MTTQDIIDQYRSLLILQYSTLPNALAEIQAIVGAILQNQVIGNTRDGFDLNTAIGKQLDILATYRGLSRIVFGVIQASTWSLIPYTDPAPNSYLGWVLYSDPDPTWLWLQYNDLNSLAYQLTDYQLRKLIQLKAALQSCENNLGNIDTVLYAFFRSQVTLIDNGNMTIIYQHLSSDPDPDQIYKKAVLARVFPHPSGVSVSMVEI